MASFQLEAKVLLQEGVNHEARQECPTLVTESPTRLSEDTHSLFFRPPRVEPELPAANIKLLHCPKLWPSLGRLSANMDPGLPQENRPSVPGRRSKILAENPGCGVAHDGLMVALCVGEKFLLPGESSHLT
ncbi:unnamed protein product [Arctogadus glacialis]